MRQPAECIEPLSASFHLRGCRQHEWDPHIDACGITLRITDDANDGRRSAVERDLAPHHQAIAPEAALPQPVTQEDDAVMTWLIGIGRPQLSKFGHDTEH